MTACDTAFYSNELCLGRAVTDVAWSPHRPELLLAAYDKGTDMHVGRESRPEGLALVWSTARITVRSAEQALTLAAALVCLTPPWLHL